MIDVPDIQHHDPGAWPVGYGQWRDADGVHIPDGCRVEQVAVAPEHGAVPSRLSKRGEVIGRGADRVNVQFGGEGKVASVRPHLLRVLDGPGS